MTTSKAIKQTFQLEKHPEGGYFKETYRAGLEHTFDGFEGKRTIATAIYYLLEQDDFSAFHRIKSDETWHFYAGDSLEVIEIDVKGELILTLLGNDYLMGDEPQYTVKAGNWFCARSRGDFSFVGCTVAPGFDFMDFEMADRKNLIASHPDFQDVIELFTRHKDDWQTSYSTLQ